jgi:hypothetical protein
MTTSKYFHFIFDFLRKERTGYGYEEFHMTEFYKRFRLAL